MLICWTHQICFSCLWNIFYRTFYTLYTCNPVFIEKFLLIFSLAFCPLCSAVPKSAYAWRYLLNRMATRPSWGPEILYLDGQHKRRLPFNNLFIKNLWKLVFKNCFKMSWLNTLILTLREKVKFWKN